MALLALTGYLAVKVWGSVTGWPLSVMILSLACLWEAGVMLMWSTLRSRADLDHVALGTACLLLGSAFVLLGVANPPDAWTLGMVAGLLVRVAFLLLGVGALLLGVAALLDRWTLVGIPFLLFGVAALLGGAAALLDGWTLVGVALLLGPVTALLLGVAFLLDRWTLAGVPVLLVAVAAPLSGVAALLAGLTLLGVAFLLFGVAFLLGGVAALLAGWTLVGVPFLLFGVAALLGGVAAFLDGWTLVGVAFLLLGIAALLGGVALLYRPELPRRLLAWLTKRDDMPLTAERPRLALHGHPNRCRDSAITNKNQMGTPAAGPARPRWQRRHAARRVYRRDSPPCGVEEFLTTIPFARPKQPKWVFQNCKASAVMTEVRGYLSWNLSYSGLHLAARGSSAVEA